MESGVGQWPKPPAAWGPLVAGSCFHSLVSGPEAMRGVPSSKSWGGGGFAGQEVRYEGRYMSSAAFNWAMCGNHIISASISPSVKWGEARERGDLFVLSVNLKM